MKFVFLCIFPLLAMVAAQENTGCPKRYLGPSCVCSTHPRPYLNCKAIKDLETLRKVFQKLNGTSFEVVHLEDFVFPYIPYDLFKNNSVEKLEIYNSSFIDLFNKRPEGMQNLRTLHIENTRIMKSLLMEPFASMVNLRELRVHNTEIKIVGKDFAEYVPKTLEALILVDTKTKDIRPGVLQNFPNLGVVAVDNGKLKELRRNMVPVPFKGRILRFSGNMLKSVPADILTDMPNLRSLILSSNNISTLPPTLFETSFPALRVFSLMNNPVYCDHNLRNLILNQPPVLIGSCSGPASLSGKELDELDPNMLDNSY